MTTKTNRERFLPWCWEAEQNEYNDKSKHGWHLKKRTRWDMSYEYNPTAQYRYAIDYRVHHDEKTYLEHFVENGWELVGTVADCLKSKKNEKGKFGSSRNGCWYIFRKPFDSVRPNTEYEITTDEDSFKELRRALTRKYRRLLIGEVFFFLDTLFLNIIFNFPNWLDYFLLTFWGVSILYTGYSLLCVSAHKPKKMLRLLIDFNSIATFMLICSCLLVIVSIVILIINKHIYKEKVTVPITAANTPVQLFLDLRPDLTIEEVCLLAEKYDLEVTAGPHYEYDVNGKLQISSYNIQLAPDPGEEYTRTSSPYGFDGVGMALVYDPTTTVMQSAYLVIDTDDGRAYCHYFPGEATIDKCETGYNLFLRKSALASQHYYHADTPEEIIDIAYPVLYPDGLE